MLPPQNRLQKEKDIEKVFKKGKSFFLGNIGARLASNNLDVSRFTVVVSLKVSKKAVKRNKLKRRIREIIRNETLSKTKSGFDVVILTKPTLLNLNFAGLREAVLNLFKKAKLIEK